MAEPVSRPDPTLVYLVLAALIGSTIFGGVYYLSFRPSHTAPVPTIYENLSVTLAPPLGKLSPDFFGMNLRPEYPPSVAPGAALNGSPIVLYRWPGGGLADRLDVFTNTVYADDGSTTLAASSLVDFVDWCRSQVDCGAIIQLPSETNDSSFVANEVRYITENLSFAPAYFEIGNEPALWTHFGVPWSSWNSSQQLNATPTSYAGEAAGLIAAIRGVNSSTPILAIGGVGQGATGEAGWLGTLAARVGTRAGGYALHVYPAGGATNDSTLAAFYQTLNSSAAIPNRLPLDRAAIYAACAACKSLPILADELGSGTGGSPYGAFESGYPEAPYVATELLQGIYRNLSSAELYAYETAYPGTYLDPQTQSPRPVALVYQDFVPMLPPRLLSASLSLNFSQVKVFAGDSLGGSNLTVWVVNTGPTAVALNWTTPYPLPVQMEVVSWAPNESLPHIAPAPILPSQHLFVPSGGMWLGRLLLSNSSTALSFRGPGPAPVVRPGPAPPYAGPLTVTRVSVPLMPGMRRTRWSTMSRASLTCPAWIFTMRSNGPVTASTSTTWGT